MKALVFIAVAVVLVLLVKRLLAGPSISAAQAQERVAAGTAVLVDVREPGEWGSGVAAPALLLPMSDLQGARAKWGPALEANRDKEFIVYCASGMRSGVVSGILRKEGCRAVNCGGFGSWRAAGLPVRQP